MTCGMLCVMRRERRGVLHLDKYSPLKANWFGGGRKEKIREKKKKRKERIKITERKKNQQFSD